MFVPVLDNLDASIFLSGHAYRNRVYHADHHNEIALPLIAPVYAAAVGRAFVRLQPAGSQTVLTTDLRKQLEPVGYEPPERSDDFFGFEVFDKSEAAQVIVSRSIDDLQPSDDEMRTALSEDLLWRLSWGAGMIRHLTKDGMPMERFIWAVDWGENWEKIRSDPELVRIDTEIAKFEAERMKSGGSYDFTIGNELNDARNKRISELLSRRGEGFDFTELERIEDGAKRLSNAKNTGSLFERYRQLDEAMERIEHRFDSVALGWDQFVQRETDRRHGK
jgi:hypothetical protein